MQKTWQHGIAIVCAIVLWAAIRPLLDPVPAEVVIGAVVAFFAYWYLIRPRLKLRRERLRQPESSAAEAKSSLHDALPPKGPFVVGRLYRVRKSFTSHDTTFHEGQLLRYLRYGFVPYDELTCYNFVDEDSELVYWSVYDSEPIDQWSDLFEAVEDGAEPGATDNPDDAQRSREDH